MRQVYVAGTGSTRFGKHAQTSIEALAVDAGAQALVQSGIDRTRIGAVYLGNFISGPLNGKEVLAGLVAEQLGLTGIPCTKVEGACASGGIAMRHACLMVATGLCDAVLVVGVETMTHASTTEMTTALNCAMDNEYDGMSGLTFPGLFGLAWRAHAQQYGTTREDIAAVVIKNKANGLKNPLAQMGADLSLAQVCASAMIADPLQLFDCCPPSDGAAAVVLASESAAAKIGAKPLAKIVAYASHSQEPEWFTIAPVGAIQKVLARTGWKASDVDLFEVNEAFATVAMSAAKDIGIAADKLNVNGGACALGHPVGATGARIVATLLHALIARGGRRGIASLCIGGGEAVAIAIERV